MKTYTAAEMRQLAGQTVDEYVQDALEYAMQRIYEAAKNKKRSVRLDHHIFVAGGYNDTLEFHQAKSKLEDLGYTVKWEYYEKQLVDMFTIVSW